MVVIGERGDVEPPDVAGVAEEVGGGARAIGQVGVPVQVCPEDAWCPFAYEERLACTWRTLCSPASWNSYFECCGVCVMIGCLVTTLWVLFSDRRESRSDTEGGMKFAELTNYAVMTALGFVLVFASLLTAKKICSRWLRDNSVTTLTPVEGVTIAA